MSVVKERGMDKSALDKSAIKTSAVKQRTSDRVISDMRENSVSYTHLTLPTSDLV